MLIMRKEKNANDVVEKFHISQPTFDLDDVYKVKSLIRRHTTKITSTEHFKKMQKERNIPLLPIYTIMKYGRVFEIKTIRGMLYRMAIRIQYHNNKDIVYVIQPTFNDLNNVHVKFISCYKNNRWDEHLTLNMKEYN